MYKRQSQGRLAAPEEQEVLARYVGWGGLPQAFDEANEKWAAEYAELKELLTPEEYASARGSTLNAHYTSPTVIQSIYEAVGRMGIQPETVLEPAMGVGNFFGLLPETMQGATLLGVELDSITAVSYTHLGHPRRSAGKAGARRFSGTQGPPASSYEKGA